MDENQSRGLRRESTALCERGVAARSHRERPEADAGFRRCRSVGWHWHDRPLRELENYSLAISCRTFLSHTQPGSVSVRAGCRRYSTNEPASMGTSLETMPRSAE